MATVNDLAEKQENGAALVSLFMRLRAKGIGDPRLFSALEQTPRQNFVDGIYKKNALDNCVLPIECGEYVERLDEQLRIIQALELTEKHRVLEVGTGSGFTAAVMSRLSLRVTTFERYKTLSNKAQQNFSLLNCKNIIQRHADALQEPKNSGPFDRIVIWPAMTEEPAKFIDFLAGNGRLIVPIGKDDELQGVTCYAKTGSRFEVSELFQVRYLPILEGIATIL